MHRIRPWLAALAALLLLSCAGCSLEIESFLCPPQALGEQKAVQVALETYIKDSGQSSTRYRLAHPLEGDHTSAFVLCDSTGMPVGEGGGAAVLAVAFYTPDPSLKEVHINLLRRDGTEWVSVEDQVGFGPSILQAAFEDLDGDGMAELITGWDTYNSNDHRLAVMALGDGITVLSDTPLYTRLCRGDITDDGCTDLLLLRISNSGVTAALHTMQDGTLIALDTVVLDGDIRQFGGVTLCRLTDGSRGLFVDGVKGHGTMVTELVRYDGTRLTAPFCHPATHSTTDTERIGSLPAWDVDGNGVPEIPLCTPLQGYEAGEELPDYALLTVWCAWDPATGEWSEKMTTVVNRADGYLVTLDENRRRNLSTEYDEQQRTLSLRDTATGGVWLRLRVPGEGDQDGFLPLYEAQGNRPGCEAWFDPSRTDQAAVQYMVSRFDGVKEAVR